MAHIWPPAKLLAAVVARAVLDLTKSQASRVSSVRGTTSMAEKAEARPMLSVPWPVKYQWWPVPMIPPPRYRMASR